MATRFSDQKESKSQQHPIAKSNQPRTSGTYRRQHEICGYELQFLLFGVLSVFQNLNYKLQRRLSDVLPIQQSHPKVIQELF